MEKQKFTEEFQNIDIATSLNQIVKEIKLDVEKMKVIILKL